MGTVSYQMPKRPPKIRTAIAIPRDLARATLERPHVALETTRGRLYLADCLAFLRTLPAGAARLVIADPPYAIAKEEWDEFASAEEYLAWCDTWLAEVHRVLCDDG